MSQDQLVAAVVALALKSEMSLTEVISAAAAVASALVSVGTLVATIYFYRKLVANDAARSLREERAANREAGEALQRKLDRDFELSAMHTKKMTELAKRSLEKCFRSDVKLKDVMIDLASDHPHGRLGIMNGLYQVLQQFLSKHDVEDEYEKILKTLDERNPNTWPGWDKRAVKKKHTSADDD